MHHPNGPALSINCDFGSASKSGLGGGGRKKDT